MTLGTRFLSRYYYCGCCHSPALRHRLVPGFSTWVHVSDLRSVPSGDGPVLLGLKGSHPAGVVLARRRDLWIKRVPHWPSTSAYRTADAGGHRDQSQASSPGPGDGLRLLRPPSAGADRQQGLAQRLRGRRLALTIHHRSFKELTCLGSCEAQ